MASNAEAKVFSGKNARILADGKLLGYAQGVTWQEDYGTQDVTAIGSFEVLEHQATVYRCSGTIQKWRLRDEVVSALRKVSPDDVLAMSTISLEIMDEISQTFIHRLEELTIAGRGGGVNAGQLLAENVQFRAIRARE